MECKCADPNTCRTCASRMAEKFRIEGDEKKAMEWRLKTVQLVAQERAKANYK